MKLSRRETLLLVLLAFLFLNLLGFKYILPLVNTEFNEKRNALDVLQLDYNSRKVYSDNNEDILKNKDLQKDQLSLLETSFYDSIKTNEVNEYISGIINQYAKQILTMELSSSKEMSVDVLNAYVNIVSVKCELSGTQDDMLKLIDVLQNDQYLIKIDSFSFDAKEGKMNLSFMVYAYEK